MRRFKASFFSILLLSGCFVLVSRTSGSAPANATAGDSLGAPAIPATSDSTRAAAPAPAPPRDYLAEARAAFTPENRAYRATRVALEFFTPLYGILMSLLVLFSGLSARIRDIAHHMGSTRYVRALVYVILFTALALVLGFPLAFYQGWFLERQYGLGTQSLGGWLGDELKADALSIFFFGVLPLVALVYQLLQTRPRRWWLWLSALTLPVITFLVVIEPVVVDPLFNRFRPLEDRVLAQKIVTLAERAGIPARRVYQVDMSTKTRKYDAYVNGFGASQRIVIWDTTLEGLSADEILFVMGHEMGHYRLGHIWQGIAFYSVLSLALFYLTSRLAPWAIARFGDRWGFHELHDVASLPLLMLTLNLLLTLAQPLAFGYSRSVEHAADTFGLELTRDNDAAARAFLKLGSQNKSDPEPPHLIELLLYDHPPDGQRIRFALSYRPWERGEPNRYFRERR